jgi:coenzyme F420-reducing hydrogenase gamma subunit
MPNKKIKLGWFSFSCSEDNTIVFTELMNDYWQDWKKIFDFRNVRALRTKNIFDEFDVAIIEGAIASESHAEKLKEIRKRSKKLIAVGACAVQGMPAGQRNNFSEEQKKRIQFLLDRFAALPKVLKVSDVVKVDAEVPGCPMDEKIFLQVINEIIKKS